MRKKLLLGLLACYIGIGLIGGVIKAVYDHRLQTEAAAWLQQAQRDAAPAWTEDAAVRWLHDHDFAWAGKGHGVKQGDSGEERYYGAFGFRELAAGDTFSWPAWVEVSFVFDLDHQFLRAEHHLLRYRPFSSWPVEAKVVPDHDCNAVPKERAP